MTNEQVVGVNELGQTVYQDETGDQYVYADDPGYREPPGGPSSPAGWLGTLAKVVIAIVSIIVAVVVVTSVAPRLADVVAVERVASLPEGETATLEVPTGATASQISELLEETGVIADAAAFERRIRIEGIAEQLRAGEYTVIGGMTEPEVIDMLVVGPPAPETYRLTVIEGLRIEEMVASLAAQTPWTEEQFSDALLSGDVTSPFLPDDLPEDTPALTAWEGLLFPATYDFVEDAAPEAILQRLSSEMVTRMAQVDWSGLEELGLTPYDGLIIASLIEKEAKLDEDRPLIASVITNRLRDEIALQIDATVIYALGENPGRVLNRDLEIDSLWNTYRYPGLPPTPIGGVRSASLEAAAAPAETNFYYYVLVDLEGKHGFSETLEQHNAKVAQARRDGVLP